MSPDAPKLPPPWRRPRFWPSVSKPVLMRIAWVLAGSPGVALSGLGWHFSSEMYGSAALGLSVAFALQFYWFPKEEQSWTNPYDGHRIWRP